MLAEDSCAGNAVSFCIDKYAWVYRKVLCKIAQRAARATSNVAVTRRGPHGLVFAASGDVRGPHATQRHRRVCEL